MAIRLDTLRTAVRRMADLESAADRFPDTEINDYVNRALARWHRTLTLQFADFFATFASFMVTAGRNSVALPHDFGMLSRVQFEIGAETEYLKVEQVGLEDMERFGSTVSLVQRRGYQLLGPQATAFSIVVVTPGGPSDFQLCTFGMLDASLLVSGQFFLVYPANPATRYVIWYRINGSGEAPEVDAIDGVTDTLLMVDVLSASDAATSVGAKTVTAITAAMVSVPAFADRILAFMTDSTLSISAAAVGATTAPSNGPGFFGCGGGSPAGTLWLFPERDASGVYRIRYHKRFRALVADSDTVEEYDDWHELAVLDAAIKCKRKDEEDVSDLIGERADLEAKVSSAAAARNASQPTWTQNVQDDNDQIWQWRR
jgi:hypothetical protein